MLFNRRMLLQSMAAAGVALPLGAGMARANGTVLNIGLSDFPHTFLPASRSVGYATNFAWSLVHARLLRYGVDGRLEGELVESWDVDGDGVWRLSLKEARFADGDPITAETVKWNIERMGSEALGFVNREAYASITTIETPDERSLILHTAQPNATIPHIFADPSFFILKPDVTDDPATIVGAGPYVMTAHENGVSMSFAPNPNYFKPVLPRFERVNVTVYSDENLRIAALMAGDVDLADYVPWALMDSVEGTPGLKLAYEAEGAFMAMTYVARGENSPMADARIRKAIAFGIRRDEIVQAVFYGRGAPMNGPPRPANGGFAHEDTNNYWRYDPDLARQLLQEAGAADGFECTMLSSSQYGMHRDTAVLVQNHLQELGIKVNLNMPDWATRTQLAAQGDADLIIQGMGGTSLDPSVLSSQMLNPNLPLSSTRSHGFTVDGLDDLAQRGMEEFDLERRREIYHEFDRLVVENTTFTGLAYRATGFGHTDRLEGFRMLPSLISPFSYMMNDEWSLTG